MKRIQLRSKEINQELVSYHYQTSKKDQLELVETEDQKLKIVFVNKKPAFFYYQNKLLPTLRFLVENINNPELKLLPQIIVDMGAIKFIIGGADIMRPGIKKIAENIHKDDVVIIIDETHHKPLALGLALFNAEEMMNMTSGKVIKNIHYVGDELWNFQL